MQLKAGTRLGPYEILAGIGAGGMGEVFKARDTRLDRVVAIKVLPASLAGDADRRLRFEREARLVASLSHPHICALHDIGHDSTPESTAPITYLVMEFLEGETLAARLARGALPLEETSRYGSDIARALDVAHRQGIVHRDLKPANVMLTRSGVKLLDFGLAKAIEPAPGATDDTMALTGMTTPGTVLGTVPYMAPEQVEGRPADARSDVFALGAVLYEMATGRRAFTGDSPPAVAAAILSSDPPLLASLPLARIVSTCLAKDPDRRWQSAQDVALQLSQLPDIAAAADVESRQRRVAWLPWTIAAVAVLGALAGLLGLWSGALTAAPTASGIAGPVSFALAPPTDGGFVLDVEWLSIAVSPDGSQVAFAAYDAAGMQSVWLRPLASSEAKPIPGTDGARSMFWSPDGKSLAFFSRGKLKRVDLAGGAPVQICAVREAIGHSGTWGVDGQILFSSIEGEGILRVATSGGTPVEVIKPDRERRERRTLWPSFLPDGKAFLYVSMMEDDSGGIRVGHFDGSSSDVLPVKSSVQYVDPGYIVLSEDSTLIARKFSPDTGTVSGDPIPLAERVMSFSSSGVAHFSASRNGVVAFQANKDESRIAAFDRTGRESAEVRPRGNYQYLRVSRDGRELLFDRANPRTTTFDVWLLEMDRDVETPVTSDAATEVDGVWAPGAVIFAAARGRAPRLFRRALDTGLETPLAPITDESAMQIAPDVSPDGKWVIYSQRSPRGTFDLFVVPATGGTPSAFRSSPFNEIRARFSPDGRFVAYTSNESGRPEIYVEPFPAGGARRTVSSGGGVFGRWSRDGRELFYVKSNMQMMNVPMHLSPSLEIGKASILFPIPGNKGWGDYDVTPDGRFIAIVPLQYAAEQPLTVIVNWPALASGR
ncbi:MAG: protein kinase [Vicinamibacterales bacterium]